MPNDLDRMFAALSADADTRPVMEASALRTRVNRRTRVRTGVVSGALAVVFIGALVAVLPGRTAQPPVVPPVVPPPSAVVVSPPLPRTIPNSAFLQKTDVNDDEGGAESQDETRPALCGARYASDGKRAVNGSRRLEFRKKGLTLDYLPDGTLEQTITVYKDNGAEQYLTEIRAAVTACRVDSDDTRHKIVTGPPVGDESIIIEHSFRGSADPEATDSELETITVRTAVIRHGDTVTMLDAHGWEGAGVEAATMTALTRSAAARLDAWR